MIGRLTNKKISIILGLPIIIIVLFVAIHALVVRGQETAISTLFISLADGKQDTAYTLYLKDSAKTTLKDQFSVTLDAPNSNINYFPPPGVTINANDFLCYDMTNPNSCSQIPSPDPSGTSTVLLSLP